MMSAFPLMDLGENFLAFSWLDTALEYACHTSLIQLMVDDGVSFGAVPNPSCQKNVVWQSAIQHICHDLLAPTRHGVSEKEWCFWCFRYLGFCVRHCFVRHLWCCIRHEFVWHYLRLS